MAVLVGKKAPSFSASAVVNGGEFIDDFSLDKFVGKKYVVFFFYPADFTFVCPTEIIAFQEEIKEFESRNVAVVGCSVDSKHSHWKWLQTELKDGGIIPEAYRGLFLIDKEGVVRHQIVNDMPLGRSIDEVLRLVDALQYSEEHGEVCPANWHKGDRTLKENAESIASYLGDKS